MNEYVVIKLCIEKLNKCNEEKGIQSSVSNQS